MDVQECWAEIDDTLPAQISRTHMAEWSLEIDSEW